LTKPISEADKRLLIMRYECLWPLRRIAAATKLSPGQVSRRLARLSPKPVKQREPKIRFITPISLSRVKGEV
jgi:DNA-binding Lrp family transcriptional regulator